MDTPTPIRKQIGPNKARLGQEVLGSGRLSMDRAAISASAGGDVLIGEATYPVESGDVEQHGRETANGCLEERPADGGEANERLAGARPKGHPLQGGVPGDGQVGVVNCVQIHEIEAVQPVKAAEDRS
jgi:hypothetical protein